ncbi:hypothetical protein [Cryptosporangium minutisporangium]|uniref:hypothetical protein n=1 Tax=Cryptosporangium minutisporangium TaxID=113569 RepID=UPI0031E4FF5F
MTVLPAVNREILAGREPPELLAARLAGGVLAELPAPERIEPEVARRLTTLLGLIGASVARHFQEHDVTRKERPADAFAELRVGPEDTPFLSYFPRLAAATGAEHPDRDCYASLVRWNAPTVEIRLGESVLAVLPGVFGDGRVRSYTGDAGEEGFFALLKDSEALELAANDAVQPMADGAVDVVSGEALDRVAHATLLLAALRQLNMDYANRPVSAGGLRPDHFMDVFRQFAVHWTPGDVPPSGAQDPEFIRRDFLLGVAWPGYPEHLRRIDPALLAAERVELWGQLDADSLPTLLLRRLGLSSDRLEEASADELRDLVSRYPALASWYFLLATNARYASTHLLLAERFLFRPQRQRDADGRGDRELVSNRRGTTGMDRPLLRQLADARRGHMLATLARVPASELARLAGLPPVARLTDADVADIVHKGA